LTLLAAVIAPAAADAAGCPAGFTCEMVAVPRDHAQPGAGTLRLEVARHDASAGAGKPLLLVFVGGPGGAAISQAPWFAEDFAPALSRYQLVVFDPRGTGATAVRCPSRQRLGEYAPLRSFVRATQRCGRRLGEAAGDYQTAATVADIETIRQTLGAERVAIYGVSYGTNVPQRYLLAHPERLETLVLDSVVGPGGLDPFSRSTFSRRQAGHADAAARHRGPHAGAAAPPARRPAARQHRRRGREA
jgi:pimeloyl-ACP methyl ester carboxylesterase